MLPTTDATDRHDGVTIEFSQASGAVRSQVCREPARRDISSELMELRARFQSSSSRASKSDSVGQIPILSGKSSTNI